MFCYRLTLYTFHGNNPIISSNSFDQGYNKYNCFPSKLFVVAEEIGLSVQDEYHRELLCVKACLNYLSDNWRTKV